MRNAAILTSQVMDAVSRLPGIATLDWCDRAANAMSRIHHPSSALVILCVITPKGVIERVQAIGASNCTPGFDALTACAPGRANAKPTVACACTCDVNQLRDAVEAGDVVGWDLGTLAEEGWCVSTASQQGLLGAKSDSPLVRRWAGTSPTDVILGAVNVPGPVAGRTLLVEIASADAAFKTSDREQAVVAAALPMLALRAHAALGDETVGKHQWLTPREELVLWRLVAGLKVPQIAAELHRSVYTVHDHVKSLHRKLGASNRGQLVARALGHLGPTNLPTGAEPGEHADEAPPTRNGRARVAARK